VPETPALANLERNGAVALTCSLPTSYRTVQIRGTVTSVRDRTPTDLARVDEHAEASSSSPSR
jgi:hypothetical protein